MKRTLILAVMVGALSAASVSAQQLRVGPTAPTNGYPAWYQDNTGVALEFCQPLNQAELDGGWCLLLPGDTTVPEAFPARFADEHFYFAAQSAINFTGGSALLVLGLEAAFAQGPVAAGDQVVFARVRIRIDNLPFNGTYTVYHPYGTDVIENQLAGGRLAFTEDIGIACPAGQFDCAQFGRIGPFLLPSNTPGGPELPAVAGPVGGKMYLANPAREGAVTGSPVGQNFFRVVHQSGWTIESSNFALMGRIFTGAISGKVTVDRASYASTAGATPQNKLDVFATAFPATQTRLPAGPPAAAVQPMMAFYPGACVATPTGTLGPPTGVAGVQMLNDGRNYFAQIQPDAIPPAVCVGDLTARDINGQVVPLFSEESVTDQVTVQSAVYDPAAGGTLTVQALSSDTVNPLALTVLGYGPMAAGLHVTGSLLAPPARVRVASSRGGQGELLVSTGAGTAVPAEIPIAGNDGATATEDGGPVTIAVLANDFLNGSAIDPAAATVSLVGAPRLGTAAVTAPGEILYTPSPNASGIDSLAYTVTVVGSDGLPKTSPAAFVGITVAAVNDPPVAVNDTSTSVANVSISINVLANDTDIDGGADLSHAEILSQPTDATAVAAGPVITFTAAAPGTYTFTYFAVDAAGDISAPATVTVNITGNETITVARAEFIRSTLRWRVEGTTSLRAGQTITIAYDNGTLRPLGTSLVGYVIGTAVVDAAGAWALDLRLTSATDPRNPSATNVFVIRPNRVRITSPLGGFATAAIALK